MRWPRTTATVSHPLGLEVESWAYWKTPRQQLARLAVHTAASCGSQNWTATWCVMSMLVKWHRKCICFGHCFNDANRCKSKVKRHSQMVPRFLKLIYISLYVPTNDAGPYLLQIHYITAPSLTLRSAEHLIMRHAVFCERQSEEPCGLDTNGVIPVWKVGPQKSCPQQCIIHIWVERGIGCSIKACISLFNQSNGEQQRNKRFWTNK